MNRFLSLILVMFAIALPGEFFHTISILFENKKPDIQFDLSGEITNQ